MTTTAQQVNADIQRLMAPTLRLFVVTLDYREEVEVMAASENHAIDIAYMATERPVRVLSCNNLEVIV
jgi:hypothetical protein